MIEKLTNFSRKSFKKYTTAIEFNNKNLIFGYNGRGKTSLAQGLAEEHENDDLSSESLRHFSKDYIRNNLMLAETENNSKVLKGVSASFSKKDVDTELEIKKLKQDLISEKEIEDGIEILKKEIRKSIDTKHTERKGTLSIAKKNQNIGLKDVIQRYEKDILEARKIQKDEEMLKNYQGDDSIEREIFHLDAIKIIDFDISDFSKECIEKLKVILSNEYNNNSIPSSEIVGWLNEGLKFHKSESRCKFCESEINFIKIEERVQKYNENIKQKDSEFIEKHHSSLEEWLKVVGGKRFLDFQKDLNNYFEESEVVDIFGAITQATTVIKEISNRLKKKIADMDKIDIKSMQEFENAIVEINAQKKQLDDLRSDKLKDLRNQNENQSTLVKGAIGLAIRYDSNIQNKLKNLEIEKNKLQEAVEDNKCINDKIVKLQNQTSDHEDFRLFLNNVLQDVQINMELIPYKNGKNYTLQHNKFKDTPLTTEDISEGEKNLLALLFFYFELFEDSNQKKFKNSIKTIIIDDPVSSLDDANKFYVLEMMKSIFTDSNISAQVFVLTHVWDDFCQLSYGLKITPESPYTLFEVYKNSNSCSEIRLIQSNTSPYKKLFKEIHDFTKKDISKMTDCDTYHIPNSMRRVFEEFLQFKNRDDIIPTKRQQKKIESIIIQSTDKKQIDGRMCLGGDYLSNVKKTKLGQLLTIINVLSHEARYNPDELLLAAKFMMKIIEDMDGAHYQAMVG